MTDYPTYVTELADAEAHVARLLSALKGVVKDARPTNWDDDDDPEQVAAWEAAHDAIAKAEGYRSEQ